MNKQIFRKDKNNRIYKPITPIDGWSDRVTMPTNGFYLINVKYDRPMEDSSIKLFGVDDLIEKFKNFSIDVDKLRDILKEYTIEKPLKTPYYGFSSGSVIDESTIDSLIKIFVEEIEKSKQSNNVINLF